jgi:hypothetical protein
LLVTSELLINKLIQQDISYLMITILIDNVTVYMQKIGSNERPKKYSNKSNGFNTIKNLKSLVTTKVVIMGVMLNSYVKQLITII